MDDAVAETFKKLVEDACRESLREVVSLTASAEAGTRSIDSVIKNATARVLQQKGAALLGTPGGNVVRVPSAEVHQEQSAPLLGDVQGIPWAIWREPNSMDGSCSEAAESALPSGQPGRGIRGASSSKTLVSAGLVASSSAAQRLVMRWHGRPQAVFLVVQRTEQALASLRDMATWLATQGIAVVLEPKLLEDNKFLRSLDGMRTFSEADRLQDSVDLVITIGSSRTVTTAVSFFPAAMPPVLAFASHERGFLTPFLAHEPGAWIRTLAPLFSRRAYEPLPVLCRMRLRISVRRARGGGEGDVEVQCLNEVCVHRGVHGAVVKLSVDVNDETVTQVAGDGLILATPTGSTAYSLAAGGSMVHPAVPAMLLTPISSHTLSFRPVFLPESATVTIKLDSAAVSGAVLIVDGKPCSLLSHGDRVVATMSEHPVPTICNLTDTRDWFGTVHEVLRWNGRIEQKGARL